MIGPHHFKAQGLKDLEARVIIDRYTIAGLAAHLPVSEAALIFCADQGLRTTKELYRAVHLSGGLLARPGCSPPVEQELRKLIHPPHLVGDWPPLEDPWERIQQHYAHLPKRCRTVLNTWLSQCTDPALGLNYLIHSDHPFQHFRGVGPDHIADLDAWRMVMRPIHPPTDAPIDYATLRGEQPGTFISAAPLEAMFQGTLTEFANTVLHGSWYGSEAEAVSYYAFAFLTNASRAGSLFSDPAQLTLGGRVPGRAMNTTKDVFKDLVLWPDAGTNGWNEARELVRYPLVVMQWKTRGSTFASGDLKQLVNFTNGQPGMLGIAVTFDVRSKDVLRAAKVMNGLVDEDWLVCRSSR